MRQQTRRRCSAGLPAAFPTTSAIRTGTPSNVFVLDIDGDQGAASLREIEAKHGALPATLISTTGNGRHIWFVARDPIPCSTAKIGAGIDVKADGGYVAAPPSIHPNGKIYQWIDASIVPTHAPDWLVATRAQEAGADDFGTRAQHHQAAQMASPMRTDLPRSTARSKRSPPRCPVRATTRSTAQRFAYFSSSPAANSTGLK